MVMGGKLAQKDARRAPRALTLPQSDGWGWWHGHVCILLRFTQFCLRTNTKYQPYGRWPHVPEFVGTGGGHRGRRGEWRRCLLPIATTVQVIYPSVAIANSTSTETTTAELGTALGSPKVLP